MEIQTRSFQGGKRLSYLCLLGIFVYTALPHGVRDGFRNPNSGLLVTVRAGELRGSASTHNESAPPEVPPEKKEGEQTSSGLKGDSLLADQEPSNTDNKDTFQDDTVSRRQGDEASEQPTTREADEAGAEPTDEAPVTEDSGYYSQEPSEPDEIYERRGQPEQEDEYEQWVTAFDVPEQLRRRIEGDDPMYYNLVLEERLYLMDSQAVPPADQDGADGEGARRQVEDPSSLLVAKKNGVYAVCYARTEDDVWERCAHAAEAAEGIYIQMHEMTDFGRMVDPEEGVDPSTVKAELTADHYTRSLRDLGKSWFGNIKDMKEMTGLKVAGIWFGPPDFERMDALLKKYPDVFDGIYVDWEDGVGACPDKVGVNGHSTPVPNGPSFFSLFVDVDPRDSVTPGENGFMFFGCVPQDIP